METQLLYRNKGFRIFAALIASYYILFHGRSPDFIGELQNPVFYIAFTVSFAIALLLVTWVHFVTTSLDARFDWHAAFTARLFRQFIFGVLVPLVFDFTLMSVYFYFMGTSIFDNGFIRHDFPVIVCFILLLNFYYMALYLYKYQKIKDERPVSSNSTEFSIVDVNNGVSEVAEAEFLEEDLIDGDQDIPVIPSSQNESSIHGESLIIKHDGLFAHFNIRKEVLYFYKEGRKIILFSKRGKDYIFSDGAIDELANQLKDFDFYKTKRSALINFNAIRGYSTTPQRDTFKLILKKKFEAIIPEKNQEHFLISRRVLSRFKNRFGKI